MLEGPLNLILLRYYSDHTMLGFLVSGHMIRGSGGAMVTETLGGWVREKIRID